MGSTPLNRRLTGDEIENAEGLVVRYLIRHLALAQEQAPPDPATLLSLVNASVTPWRWKVIQLLQIYDGAVDGYNPISLDPAMGLCLRMPDGRVVGLQILATDIPSLAKVGGFPDVPLGETITDLDRALSGEPLAAFQAWIDHHLAVQRRVVKTANTIHEILDMCCTVGQLHRVCPELVKYTYSVTQSALSQQERRSPVPSAWHRMSRAAVRDALDHLALCYLLPEVEANAYPLRPPLMRNCTTPFLREWYPYVANGICFENSIWTSIDNYIA